MIITPIYMANAGYKYYNNTSQIKIKPIVIQQHRLCHPFKFSHLKPINFVSRQALKYFFPSHQSMITRVS